jgi:hypothetical protein
LICSWTAGGTVDRVVDHGPLVHGAPVIKCEGVLDLVR